ncbi:MAG: hypothetical protein IJF69_01935 [Clostridia bacterium]|nr:hypothetical protein [Clostridia bacterium]
MTGIQIQRENNYRFQAIYAASVIICLAVSLLAGIRLETAENTIILPRSPFPDGEFFRGAVRLCIWDVPLFWLHALSLSKALRITASSAVIFFRGLVIGNSLKVFFENSVPSVTVFVLMSYIVVTLLLMVYDVFLNCIEIRSIPCRVLSCLVATGAAAVIRILPMLLI